ncbi:MAG TPA: penicillin acylase family protein [Rhodanobacteraceae bacterium]|nr:penicillin acylase family protein [Rhodanobacteraceae bacterium]
MRRIVRVLAVALVLLALASAGAYFALRASLPQYDGVVQAAALSKPVTVERDHNGTVTIHAENRRDLTWTLGYVHAQERFFEMDLLRRRAAGELAELFGTLALPTDRIARAHRMRARAHEAIAKLSADDRDELAAYRDGVNAGLAALSVRPFPYLLTRSTPAPWQDEDTPLVVGAMAFTLNDAENKRELAFAAMHAALPESAYKFLTAMGGSWDAPIAGPPLEWPATPPRDDLDLHALDPKLLKSSERADRNTPGSSSFAVTGALAGGAALVANDMHLDLRVPGLWFRARAIFPNPRRAGRTVDVSGASLPGTPAIIAGSNTQVAWGFTNAYADTTDWVRVERDPAHPDQYKTSDGFRPIEKHEEIIRVHGGDDVKLAVEDTEWGPIIGKDTDGTPLALAWTAQQPGAFNFGLQRLELAETADEAVAIAQAAGVPPQNFVVGDRNGNIAWTIAGNLAKRSGDYDAHLPADWTQPGTGWDGWLDAKDHPLIANPPWQRLWTANQRVTEAPWLATVGDGGYDIGARARQIRDDLRAREKFAPADMLEIQLDDRALFLDRWKELLALELNRAPKSAQHEALSKALAEWSGHASIDSVGYRVVKAWRGEVVDAVLDAFAAKVRMKFPDFAMPYLAQGEHAVWQLLRERPAHLLPPGYADWDAFLIACADRAAANLDKQPGGIAARTWGERNTMRIAHPLSSALPRFLARKLDMPPDELPGDRDMPRVQSPTFGASERFAVAPGDEAHGYFMLAGGQSGHPLSPYYGAGHADWAAGKPTPFLPGPAEHTLTFEPR